MTERYTQKIGTETLILNHYQKMRKILPKNTYIVFFLICVSIVILRAPNLLIRPRFWAEEGSNYFKFAYSHGFFRSLYYIDWRAGYFNLISTISSVIAAYITPLKYAPFVTTYVSFVIQIIPFAIILLGKSTVFRGTTKKLIGCCIILLAPSLTSEVWLNTINLQVFFGLIAILILLENLEKLSQPVLWAYRILLAVGGLSGVYVFFLQPIFLIKALVDRNKERYIQFSIVSLAFIIQFGIFLYSKFFLKAWNEKRSTGIEWHHVGATVDHQIIRPILGRQISEEIISYLGEKSFYLYLSTIFLIAVLSLIIFLITKGFFLKRKIFNFSDPRLILSFSWITLAIGTTLASLNHIAGARYAVLPGFVLLFFVLANIHFKQYLLRSIILTLLLVISLSSGLRDYKNNDFSCDGLYWQEEIESWHQNPKHRIQICPPSWYIEIY